MKGGLVPLGKKKFYDTNTILDLQDKMFEDDFCISSISLQEMENIKTSGRKDEETKYKARKALHLLDENKDKYEVVIYTTAMESYIAEKQLEITPDTKIIASCAFSRGLLPQDTDFVFVTNDIACKMIASKIFGLEVESVGENKLDNYKGFVEKSLSEEDMAYFYEHNSENIFGLFINQYLILKDGKNEIVDAYRWNGTQHEPLFKRNIQSLYFDKLKSKDIYQSCAIDSLMNCTITAITGKAGSGKSLLALMSAMYLIEKGKYDRIVVMFNPTKTRGASDMGFYGGDFIDKAMQNSIGQILTTKFGDRYAVDLLLSQNKLKLVSMADCRGMEISDSEILWITESQNTSIDLIKLCLSRVSSGAKVFIEGDYLSQVDSNAFDGNNNGLKRMIDVFKGHEEFGYVQLQNVWRSKIAELCELL